MFQALNMDLDIIRTVIKNETNEIFVCRDQKRETGAYYTVVSINSAAVRKEVASLIAAEGLFATNSDYIGSFTYRDSFNLVFLYQRENRLCNQEPIYAQKFTDRKNLSTSFLIACAECEVAGSIGNLLLREHNINISSAGKVYFNYFLDFHRWNREEQESDFYRCAANYVFGILSREYQVRFDGDFERFPKELQLFYRKAQIKGFTSFNHILTFIKTIPDQPSEQHFGLRRLWERAMRVKDFVAGHSMPIFLTIVVAATLVFFTYQMFSRLSAKNYTKENTMYIGMDRIGEVFLGDEDV